MTISKGGKNYTIPSSYKTLEDDYITISMGYKAKQVFNKSEIVTLIEILTKILNENNKEEQIQAEAIEEFADWLVEKEILGNRVISDGEITTYGKVYAKQFIEQLKENK